VAEGGGRNAETRGSRSEAEIVGDRDEGGSDPQARLDASLGSACKAIEAVAELVNCFHDRMEIGRTPLAPVVQFSPLRRRTFKHSINHPETTL
jgi:hypothetical protein